MSKFILFSIFLFFSCLLAEGQKRGLNYQASLESYFSKENTLAFWQRSNRYGVVPDGNNGLLQAGLYSGFAHQHAIDFSYGISAAGFLSKQSNKIILDQAYVSAKWKNIRLDLGLIHPDMEYGGISSSNGNIIYSNNSRTLPGINLRTDFIRIPFNGNFLYFKFNLAEYRMIDNRFAENTRLHNKSLFINLKPTKKIDIIIGLEHWAQWAGKSPVYGKQPHSFRDYVRIFAAQSGGEGATLSDSINALGNHLGREYIRLNYYDENYTISFYHDIPFEDGSGMRLANIPDGIYGIYYGSKKQNRWISDVIYEFIYTKSQSGRHHDRPATPEEKEHQDPHSPTYGKVILGGNDNYFNNGEYRSGWTYYGRTIGSPFLTPVAPNKEGITLGIYNNRVLAHYLGLKGYIAHKLPYKLRLSYSLNYGKYSAPLADTPRQFSFGLETGILNKPKAPCHIHVGIYGDFGKLLKNNLGISLQITRNGLLK